MDDMIMDYKDLNDVVSPSMYLYRILKKKKLAQVMGYFSCSIADVKNNPSRQNSKTK